jgi:hypothetical protein
VSAATANVTASPVLSKPSTKPVPVNPAWLSLSGVPVREANSGW